MERQKLLIFGLMILLIIGIVFLSGCVHYPKVETAPEAKPIDTNTIVATYYITGWGLFPGQRSSDWSLGTRSRESPLTPKLGLYKSADPNVADWHIKWATEHGISVFVVPFTEPRSGWENAFEKGLLKANNLKHIKFAMLFNNEPYWPDNIERNDADKLDELTSKTIAYFADNYFDHPQYFKINDKPIIFLYHAQFCYSKIGQVRFEKLIDNIRDTARSKGHEVYLIGDIMETTHDKTFLAKYFDAITTYDMVDAGSEWTVNEDGVEYVNASYDDLIKGYIDETKFWSEVAKNASINIVVPLEPGADTLSLYTEGIDRDWTNRYGGSPEKFKQMIKSMKPYIDPELNLVIIESWNEFQEGSVIEPTEEYGFQYLESIRESFGRNR